MVMGPEHAAANPIQHITLQQENVPSTIQM